MIGTDKQTFSQGAAERVELIEQLLAIGTALSSASDLEEILSLILTKSREITCSDAGSVYLVDYSLEKPNLVFKVAQNFSKPTISFQEFAMPVTEKSLAGYVAMTGKTLNLPDAYELSRQVPYQLDRSFDQRFAYRTCSILVLPMQNQKGETIGVLQLINRKLKPGVVVTAENAPDVTQPFSHWEEQVVRSLASQAAISIERNHLQDSIEHLFEGFVRAAVQIIETRDPCTSGHSERVAELTVQLSQEVNSVQTGSLGPIYFGDRQIQEIRYAALLHDFGKVGVPEAILGKAKKLYPLQLEVIKGRFALAQRTLEMECVQAKYQHLLTHSAVLATSTSPVELSCSHCQAITQLDTKLSEAIAQLNHYWNILVAANEPRIFAEKPLAALKELAHYKYRDVDGSAKPLLAPEEIDQLIVRRGNLTAQERQAIQSHVTHTYEFLKRIPWTQELQQVPAIAYGHHEKLDGTGYPRGLKQPDIPIQSQIMAIADIYDALTAGDRPYKDGLPITRALRLLKQEAAHNKLNQELVILFEQRQVFKVLDSTPND
jgi:HD-GYP domain-containing protein (c-di-GMP phosphodiesterase class II)